MPSGRSCHRRRRAGLFAGADIKEFPAMRESSSTTPARRAGASASVTVSTPPHPTIAAIRGFCLGGGLEPALAATSGSRRRRDSSAAGDQARADPRGRGDTAAAEARRLGRAMFLNLTGDFVDAETASAWGLVDRVVPAVELVDGARAGRPIASQSPLAIAVLRELARTTRDLRSRRVSGARRTASARCLALRGRRGGRRRLHREAPARVHGTLTRARRRPRRGAHPCTPRGSRARAWRRPDARPRPRRGCQLRRRADPRGPLPARSHSTTVIPDYRSIFDVLQKHKVDFVVIDAIAMVLHGSARVTRDLDICYSRGRTNLDRLARALKPFAPTLRVAPIRFRSRSILRRCGPG